MDKSTHAFNKMAGLFHRGGGFFYIPVHLPSLGIHMGAFRILAAKNTNMHKYPNMGSEAIVFYGTEPNKTRQNLKNSHGNSSFHMFAQIFVCLSLLIPSHKMQIYI
jgi:hypothetical protein